MNKNIFKVASIFIIVAIAFGIATFAFNIAGNHASTFNPIAREVGGTITVNLEPNRKLVNISWKTDNSLWILTRKMKNNEDAEEYEYKEDSSFGIIEGTVKIIEHKQ